MFCSKCGAKLMDGDLFCPSCGAKKGNVEEPAKASNTANDDLMGNHMKYGAIAIAVYFFSIIALFFEHYSYEDGWFSLTPFKIITKGDYIKEFYLRSEAGWWHGCYIFFGIFLAYGLCKGIYKLYLELSKRDYTKKGLNIFNDLNKMLTPIIVFYIGGIILNLFLGGAFFLENPKIEIMGWIVPIALIVAKVYISKERDALVYRIRKAECENDSSGTVKDSSDKKMLVRKNASDWKCPDCGRYNYSYCGTCGCGHER